jgi:hypothetical protein
MSRHLSALPTILVTGFLGMQTPAQAQLTESTVTAGFWSFPTHKITTIHDVVTACRNRFEIRFADGHFLSLGMHQTNINLDQREVESVGRCMFNREKQIDSCEIKFMHYDGSILSGTTENRYSFDVDKTLKMIVTSRMITDSPSDNACLYRKLKSADARKRIG